MTRECAGFHRQRDVEGDDEEPQFPGDPIWCEEHRLGIRDNLLAFPQMYAALHVEASYATPKPSGGRVSGSKHEPSPGPRIDDADELARWLCDWEDTIRPLLGDPASPVLVSGRARALTEALNYLLPRLTRALALEVDPDEPLGYLFGREVNLKHRDLLRLTRADRLIHKLDPPCPGCDMRSLRRDDGDDKIRCTNPDCREVWSEIEYQRLVLVLASDIA